MSARLSRIEICGGIASGKTTLATLLPTLDIQAVREDFRGNPFWRAFYADPVSYAFETEVSFLLQHYHDIKNAARFGKLFACDFSLFLDLSYAQVTLSAARRRAFLAVYREVARELLAPALLIHLRCDPSLQLKRIRRRGRKVEKSIDIGYLKRINAQLERVLARQELNSRILTVDSGVLDFAHAPEAQKFVTDQVRQQISGIQSA